MASLEWDKCAGFAIATFSVAVGAFVGARKVLPPGGQVSWSSAVLLAVSAAFLCAALILAWLALARHPRQLARKAARERARAATAKAAEQARLRPILAAWDRFYVEAGKVAKLFNDAGVMPPVPVSPEELKGAIAKAYVHADSLEEGSTRDAAKARLSNLAAIAPEKPEAGYVPAIAFADWLLDRNGAYMTARDRAGLPPADYGDAKP